MSETSPDRESIGRAAAAQPFTTRNTSVPEDPVSRAPDDARSVDPEQSQGPARHEPPPDDDDDVDETSKQSFPTSDPPSTWASAGRKDRQTNQDEPTP